MQKAWIEKMMEKGLCSCDEEHMFDCPASDRDVSAKPTEANVEQQAFNDILERILGEKVSLPKSSLNAKLSLLVMSENICVNFPAQKIFRLRISKW